MGICPIDSLIPETDIVIFAPHYDDVLFMLGGYLLEMKGRGLLRRKRVHVQLIFPRSNYLARSGAGNFDGSPERLKLASGIRLIEDLGCLDGLIGRHSYSYELAGELECFARGKTPADSEMEFPHGMYGDFDEADRGILGRVRERVQLWARKNDTALVFPMAIKEHIDHFIVREAGISVAEEMGGSAGAAFYFQEDKPYGGIASEEEIGRMESFIKDHRLDARAYEYDAEAVVALAFRHYPSQVEEVYRKGILDRAEALRLTYGAVGPCDRLAGQATNR